MANYLVHKPVELAKVHAKRRRILELPGFLDQHYMAQPKFDGCCAIVDTTKRTMVSRTGEPVTSCDHIIAAVAEAYPPGMVIFGEVWSSGIPQSEISGLFRRLYPAPDLQFVMFDAVTDDAAAAGYDPTPYHERHNWLYNSALHSAPPLDVAACYNPGTYGKHEVLRDMYLARGGYDGLILRDPDAPWIMGTGGDGAIIKSKRVLSFDLLVEGVEEGKGKLAGHAGALLLRWKGGQQMKAAGGTHALRKLWFDSPKSIVGRIVEVEAMDYSTDGLLREPRIKSIRTDKEEPDF